LVALIRKAGLRCLADGDVAGRVGAEPVGDISSADFILVLGGDGTMLRAAELAARRNKPLLGINIGHLGYLTDEEFADAGRAVDNVSKGAYIIEKRMMLEVVIDGPNGTKVKVNALNDCVIHGTYRKLLRFGMDINGENIDELSADGLIVCTPTGSTAYNLSAGGPILKPDAEMIALTPICPHALHSRPFVVSSKDVIGIRGVNDGRNSPVVSVDGRRVYPPDDGKPAEGLRVVIKKSRHCLPIIKTNGKSFYDILRQKIMGK
jgi:NAD+ kinase